MIRLFWGVHDSPLAAASAMAWRGVGWCPCCGTALGTSRTKRGKKALRLVGLALRTPETPIVLVHFLHHFERFLALSASVLINGHVRCLLLLSTNVCRISDTWQKRNSGAKPALLLSTCASWGGLARKAPRPPKIDNTTTHQRESVWGRPSIRDRPSPSFLRLGSKDKRLKEIVKWIRNALSEERRFEPIPLESYRLKERNAQLNPLLLLVKKSG